MEKAKRFEDLWIWQHARELVKEIYKDFGSAPVQRTSAFGIRSRGQAFRS
jgi:hypothetical protein